jgi:hypothetical protein
MIEFTACRVRWSCSSYFENSIFYVNNSSSCNRHSVCRVILWGDYSRLWLMFIERHMSVWVRIVDCYHMLLKRLNLTSRECMLSSGKNQLLKLYFAHCIMKYIFGHALVCGNITFAWYYSTCKNFKELIFESNISSLKFLHLIMRFFPIGMDDSSYWLNFDQS